MTSLLEQFLSEARDFLQNIGERLMGLEQSPDDTVLMTELFRFVHTLKGNSGLFDFPEMTRVLHAAEDLMDAVRNGHVAYSQDLADRLLDAMDFVSLLCDEIEGDEQAGSRYSADSVRLAESLRDFLTRSSPPAQAAAISAPISLDVKPEATPQTEIADPGFDLPLQAIPECERMRAFHSASSGKPIFWLRYQPVEGCFFSGEDPFYLVRTAPSVLWGAIETHAPWPKLLELDAYHCTLVFSLLSESDEVVLREHFRYVPEQIELVAVPALALIAPQGALNGGVGDDDFVTDALALLEANNVEGLLHAAQTLLESSNPELWIASALRWLILLVECTPDDTTAQAAILHALRERQPIDWRRLSQKASTATMLEAGQYQASEASVHTTQLSEHDMVALRSALRVQHTIVSMPIEASWQLGRLQAASAAIGGCLRTLGQHSLLDSLASETANALTEASSQPLQRWFSAHLASYVPDSDSVSESLKTHQPAAVALVNGGAKSTEREISTEDDSEHKFGRRAEDSPHAAKSLKVDQIKIDRLMNLIGEIVVAKNSLPYLAARAESVFGVRELSREIKGQYAVINRIAEEMQDAIMQVRMMPVSFVFQRFPRLVRDTSRKLGKEVNLMLEGESTEADKNIIEALSDPLVHIVRNSLDHGFEMPEVRLAAGKPQQGTLTIRARQESDRVIIEIMDDGKGIDPALVKRKALSKGLIDESAAVRMSDQEAVNLVFASGFSTADVISDLSGRGVGMDVVRTAVERVNGTISLDSEIGKGTRLRLALPLSMAITNVMIVESSGQIFGVPMDCVMETVRVPREAVRTIKSSMATVLRGKIIPLKAINTLLAIDAPPKANEQGELAVLVVRLGDDAVGLLVDEFHETIDIILKPLSGVLQGLIAYSGSALMGDGSVLLVLNVKELI